MKAKYLTEQGGELYDVILEHCKEIGVDDKIDYMELSMLANAIDLHARSASEINEQGYTMTHSTGSKQVSPSWNVYKETYNLVLKHSPRFGLNPSDREKLIKAALEREKQEAPFTFEV